MASNLIPVRVLAFPLLVECYPSKKKTNASDFSSQNNSYIYFSPFFIIETLVTIMYLLRNSLHYTTAMQ